MTSTPCRWSHGYGGAGVGVALLVALVVTLGWPGRLVLGAVFVVTGLLVPPATSWALRVPPAFGSARSAVADGGL